jgi:hypothetical protein
LIWINLEEYEISESMGGDIGLGHFYHFGLRGEVNPIVFIVWHFSYGGVIIVKWLLGIPRMIFLIL